MAKLPELFKADVQAQHTLEMPVFFGKYKGMLVEDILAEDPGWLLWAHLNVRWFKLRDEVFKMAAREHQKQRRVRTIDHYETRAEGSHVNLTQMFDELDHQLRRQMSGNFGVHMCDMDLFLEGEHDDPDGQERDWRDGRDY